MHPTRCSFDSGSRRRLGAFTLAAVAGLAATAPLALAAESASLSESARSALTLDAAETYSQPADPAAAPLFFTLHPRVGCICKFSVDAA